MRAMPHPSLQPFAHWALRPAALGAAGRNSDELNIRKWSAVLSYPANSREKGPASMLLACSPTIPRTPRRLSIAMAWEQTTYELEKTQGRGHGPSAPGVGRKGTIHHVRCAISTVLSLLVFSRLRLRSDFSSVRIQCKQILGTYAL